MDKNIARLIEKFFNEGCSEEEELILNEWYNSYNHEPNPPEMIDPLIRAWLEDLTLKKINKKIRQSENDQLQTELFTKNKLKRSLIYALSSMAAILVIGIAFYMTILKQPPVYTIAQNNQPETVRYINNSKNLRKFVLSDGSVVWLSPQSSLEAAPNFRKKSRNVRLEGMAFFQVTKNKDRPFIITTPSIITKVWGTSFTVNAYKTNPTARVSVLTGKVSVSVRHSKEFSPTIKNDEIMLYPHQDATYSSAQQILTKHTAMQNEDLRIWKKVDLAFHNAKIREVIKKLNQEFKVHISTADDKVNNYLFIADLTGQDLPSILEILKTSLDIQYEINKNEITLRSNN